MSTPTPTTSTYPSGHTGHLSTDQQSSLDRFKALCTESGHYQPLVPDHEHPSHSDETLLRFLRARRWIPKDALDQFVKTEKWMQETRLGEMYEKVDVDEYESARRMVRSQICQLCITQCLCFGWSCSTRNGLDVETNVVSHSTCTRSHLSIPNPSLHSKRPLLAFKTFPLDRVDPPQSSSYGYSYLLPVSHIQPSPGVQLLPGLSQRLQSRRRSISWISVGLG